MMLHSYAARWRGVCRSCCYGCYGHYGMVCRSCCCCCSGRPSVSLPDLLLSSWQLPATGCYCRPAPHIVAGARVTAEGLGL